MNRCLLLCISFLAACQVSEDTNQTDQTITTGDYCGAKIPFAPAWVPGEQPPQIAASARVVIWESKPGDWLAVVADPEIGQITWARHVSNKDFGPFIGSINVAGQIDISRPPPPPPPPDGTDDLRAPVVVEMSRIMNAVPNEAYQNIQNACGPGPMPPPK